MEVAVTKASAASDHLMQGFYLVLIFQVKGTSINCNDLDAGVRMKHAFLNKEVEITRVFISGLC